MKAKIPLLVTALGATACFISLLYADEASTKADKLATKFPQWAEAQKLKGDAATGKAFFESHTVNNNFTCISCHSFNPDDTFKLDGDKLIRSGNPIFGAAQRTNIKNEGSSFAALGGNICVLHFMRGKEPGLSAQELANLNAFLKSGGGADHATAKNLDYPKMKRTVPEKLTGGDAERGQKIATEQYCIACHTVEGKKYLHFQGGRKLRGGTVPVSKLKGLALRIRNPDFKENDEMPGHDDLRMPEKDLLDILAWLTEK